MTTTVVVSLPDPNHKRAQVTAVDPETGQDIRSVELGHGESTQMYLHGNQALRVTEIE